MYTLRYLVSLGLTLIACSMFYTMLIMLVVTKFLPLEETSYWIISGILFVIITVASLKFYIPRLRNIW